MVQGIKDMLDRNISFSLYITHGGTTFGHWGGANNPAYSAMCSSYDYDAPISEAGWTTEKFFLLRDLLKNYLPAGESLPEVPAALPVIEIPEIHFNKVAPLFSNLPEAKQTVDIQPMEQFNQGWGTILYRTTLSEATLAGTVFQCGQSRSKFSFTTVQTRQKFAVGIDLRPVVHFRNLQNGSCEGCFAIY